MPAESPKLINLSDCTHMVEVRLPAECSNLESLNLRDSYDADAYDADDADDADDTGICDLGNTWPEFKFSCDYKEDPASSFGNLERLISLGFGARINADSFSDIICGLQCLRKLTLEGGIPEAPKNLDRLDSLEELSLRSTDIKTLPDSICMLKHLKYLKLESCLLLEKLPVDIGRLECLELGYLKLRTLHLEITPNLETLRLRDCTDMVELRMPAECPKLVNLNLGNLKLTTLHLGITPNLETLRLRDCTDMVELRMPAECPKLVNLDLDNLKLTTLHLGITPNLETLRVKMCTDMVELQIPCECPKFVDLDLSCSKLKTLDLGKIPNLK
ncbi:Toll/interleukin-1 receptor domain-containing protein, partial [Tanacetum coccineum]